METLITNLLPQLVLLIAAWFLGGKMKAKSESKNLDANANKVEVENNTIILDTYKKELASVNERLSNYLEKINCLERKVEELKDENRQLKRQLIEITGKHEN